MADLPIVVLTNKKHHWLLPGYCFLHNKYWGSPAEIVSYGKRPPEVPDGFSYRMINKNNFPAKRWSSGLITFLERIDDPLFILMLEDYWLSSEVNLRVMRIFEDYVEDKVASGEKILRFDLSVDRSVRKQCRPYDTVRYPGKRGEPAVDLTIIESPPHTPYQMSLQAAIWNRELLLEILKKNKTAWEVEVEGTEYLKTRKDLIVLGTKYVPLKYRPTYRAHKNSFDFSHLNPDVQSEMRAKGLLNRK